MGTFSDAANDLGLKQVTFRFIAFQVNHGDTFRFLCRVTESSRRRRSCRDIAIVGFPTQTVACRIATDSAVVVVAATRRRLDRVALVDCSISRRSNK